MSDGPVYLRVEVSGSRREIVDLVELLPDGTVGRDIGIGPDGKPTYVTRASQAPYGPWESQPPAPPGTAAFAEYWGDASAISADEFEAVYAVADATLPSTWGGIPTWVSMAAMIVIGLIVVVGVVVIAWLAGAALS